MEKLYTPEPWKLCSTIGTVQRTLVGIKGEGYIDMVAWMAEGWDVDEETQKANARRIVACVNACRSVSDEDLADDCVEKMKADRDALLIQRDELLAALNLVAGISCEIDTIERCESWEGGSPEYGTVVTFGKIKQRISKVKSLIEKYHA